MSEISIVHFIPALQELNDIYASIIDNGRVYYSQQVAITEYYNSFSDMKAVRRMILSLIVDMETEKSDLLLARLAEEIKKNIHFFRSYPDLWLKLDIDQVCRQQGVSYMAVIQPQMVVVNELYNELKLVLNELDYSGFKGFSEHEREILDGRCEKLKCNYEQESEKLSGLYADLHECLMRASHYSANLFDEIYQMHCLWVSFLGCYYQPREEEIEPHKVKNETPPSDIKPDMIFHSDMYARFLVLEARLQEDDYLSGDLQWIFRHKNGRQDVKSLVIFLIALLDKGYFLPNRDSRIKHFFEARYQLSIGQNFEPRRRLPLLTEYKQVFVGYPF